MGWKRRLVEFQARFKGVTSEVVIVIFSVLIISQESSTACCWQRALSLRPACPADSLWTMSRALCFSTPQMGGVLHTSIAPDTWDSGIPRRNDTNVSHTEPIGRQSLFVRRKRSLHRLLPTNYYSLTGCMHSNHVHLQVTDAHHLDGYCLAETSSAEISDRHLSLFFIPSSKRSRFFVPACPILAMRLI